MKFVTEEELAGHHRATVRGAIEGTLAGLAISVPGSFYLNRRWAYFRSLPIQLKALGVVMIVAPLYAVQAERRGYEFDRSTWTGAGMNELQREEAEKEKKWLALGTKDKLKQWAAQNQYKVIMGSWALSMAAAGLLVWRDRHQTPAQKVVQARMWAQGLTIGVLIAAGIMTHGQRQQAAEHRAPVDHSWANMVEEYQHEEQEAAKLRDLAKALPAPASHSA